MFMFLASSSSIPGIYFDLDFLTWIIVGLLAGFFASLVVRGRGYGCLGNLVVGLLGGVIGGYLASLLNIQGNFHFWGSVSLSFIGAVILVAILQAFSRSYDRSRYRDRQ